MNTIDKINTVAGLSEPILSGLRSSTRAGLKNKYRLRSGKYRVLFELEGSCLAVYDVGDRKDIYE